MKTSVRTRLLGYEVAGLPPVLCLTPRAYSCCHSGLVLAQAMGTHQPPPVLTRVWGGFTLKAGSWDGACCMTETWWLPQLHPWASVCLSVWPTIQDRWDLRSPFGTAFCFPFDLCSHAHGPTGQSGLLAVRLALQTLPSPGTACCAAHPWGCWDLCAPGEGCACLFPFCLEAHFYPSGTWPCYPRHVSFSDHSSVKLCCLHSFFSS